MSTPEFDITRYADLLAEANRAFRLDTSYAIDVAKAAQKHRAAKEVSRIREEKRALKN